jgi:hypothetical protein
MNEKVLRSVVRDLFKNSLERKDCQKSFKEMVNIVVDEAIVTIKDSHLTKKDIKTINNAKDLFLLSLNCVEHSQ